MKPNNKKCRKNKKENFQKRKPFKVYSDFTPVQKNFKKKKPNEKKVVGSSLPSIVKRVKIQEKQNDYRH